MRIYENRFSNPNEGEDTFVLTLHDDHRFELDLSSTTYASSTGSTARGRWQLAGASLSLQVDEGGAYLDAGKTYTCAFSEDAVTVKSFELRRKR